MIKRALEFYTRTFAIWIVCFAVVAFYYPKPFVFLGRIKILELVTENFAYTLSGNMLFFALTMFGIGVALNPADFKQILKKPWIVAIGSAAQFTIMPLGAYLLAKAFNLSPIVTVGLILTGAAPGAMASNVMSYVAKADAAYSVSLTTVSTLLCPLLTPLLTGILAGSTLPIPMVKMFVDVLIMVLIPLLFGFLIRRLFGPFIEKILPVFPALSVTFIIFVCSVVIALNRKRLPQLTGVILATGVILNLYGTAMGYGVGHVCRMTIPRRRALAIEIGMQNAGLGSVLALENFGEEAALPAALFVFICIITASILAGYWQRCDATCGIKKLST
ncbi:bile acid:sodium symporter family protein [Planctomycetota bacterium]